MIFIPVSKKEHEKLKEQFLRIESLVFQVIGKVEELEKDKKQDKYFG